MTRFSFATALLFFITVAPPCDALAAFQQPTQQRSCRTSQQTLRSSGSDDESTDRQLQVSSPVTTDRRSFIVSSILSATVAGIALRPDAASAADPLFRKNPLTNPVLEKIRVWNQAEADEIKYGGELAPGYKDPSASYSKLLVPILSIEDDLIRLNSLITTAPNGITPQVLTQAKEILSHPHFVKKEFKKTFNAYGDNIYYSDPDRANAYLGGGAVPRNEQSMAYLLRNDILTNVEAAQAEVDYLLKQEDDVKDLLEYVRIAKEAMGNYVGFVPPNELKEAREMGAQK